MIASFATLAWLGLIPLWLLILVLSRDIVIVIGGLVYHYFIGAFELSPVWSSKINTVAQIGLVLVIILQQYGLFELQAVVDAGVWLVAASILISGSEYILIWGSRAWQPNNKQ